MNILDYLTEPLTLPFMMRAVLVTVAAAAVCALLSCWLIMLGWSLMGDAISHAVLPGVVLAYIAGAPFAVGAVVAALVAVALIGAGTCWGCRGWTCGRCLPLPQWWGLFCW